MSREIDSYPDSDFPWHFYFNGQLMPKWGSLWGMLGSKFLNPEKDWDEVLGHRDVMLISFRMDHVGQVESADPTAFIYAAQEMLMILLSQRDEVMMHLQDDNRYPSIELYEGLVAAAFQMRRLAAEQHMAFWLSGYEADRERLVEAMECSRLPADNPRFKPAPHLDLVARRAALNLGLQSQKLHKLAQSGSFKKEWRRELHHI